MRPLFYSAAIAASLVAGVLILALCIGCSPSTPTPAQQADVAIYEGALQACIARAKLQDSGYYTYKACADGVTDLWFPRDGGAK